MKKVIFGCAFILVTSIMMIADQANAGSTFACSGGIVRLGNSVKTIKQKCKVISKDGSHWTVKGKQGNAVLTIQRGKLTVINKD